MNVGIKRIERTATDWGMFLKDGLINPTIDGEIVNSLIKHLADLGIFDIVGEEIWVFSADSNADTEELIRNNFILKFNNVRQIESGSLLKFFTGENLDDEDFKFPLGDTSKVELGKDKKISSNLSNYQIVRKMGRQLSPFIELEKNIIDKLEGQYVTRSDAKILFKYILSKIQKREKPREWEQISRRRHK